MVSIMWGKEETQRQFVHFFNCIRIYVDWRLFTVPGSEWTKVVQAEYQAQIASLGEENTDPLAITELFRPQIEWYRERLQANVRETKKSGKIDLTIGHYAKLATNMVCRPLGFFSVPEVLTVYTAYSLSRYIKSRT
jgi:hypothetical protein